MKKTILLLFTIMVFYNSYAYRVISKQSVVVTQPVHENLYITGGTVYINAPVYGDLIVAAGTIFINDTVQNDILLIGGTVNMNGYVGGNARVGGGELNILKVIKGELLIMGGRINVENNAIIEGGLIARGGNIIMNGTINGEISTTSAYFNFNGTAAKGLNARGDKLEINGVIKGLSVLSAREIIIGPDASFLNNVRYWNRGGSLDFKTSLKNNKAVYDQSLKGKENPWYFMGRNSWLGLLWYIGTALLMIALLEYLFGYTFQKAGNAAFTSTFKSIGIGLLFIVGVPVAVAILLITLIGIPVGLFLLLAYIGILLLATTITSVVLANWYKKQFHYNWGYWPMVFSSFSLFILFKILTFTPFIGWLIMVVLICIAFGSILTTINWKRRQPRIAVS